MLVTEGLQLIVDQGANFIQPFYYVDKDDNPIDLTDCTAKMQGRITTDSTGTPTFEWSTTGGQIVIDGPAGAIVIGVPATETAALTSGFIGVYDLFLTFPSGVVQRLVGGTITVQGRVTK